MEKLDSNPMVALSARRMRAKMLWNVPLHKPRERPGPTICAMRSFISRAALLVKVRANTCQGA